VTRPQRPDRARRLPVFTSDQIVTLGQGEVGDLILTEDPFPGNPFDAEIRVSLYGPAGRLITVPAFWEPRVGYLARISFPVAGSWTAVVTASPENGLAAVRFRIVVAPASDARRRGALEIDPEYPRSFRFADGTRFFLRGYEVNWLLAIDQRDHELLRVRAFLDSIEKAGFNTVTVNAYAHTVDPRRYSGGDAPDEIDEDPRWVLPEIAPWVGGNAGADHTAFDPEFFAHADAVIAELHRRGLVTHLMIHVYNKEVNWPEAGSPGDDRFWRYLIARYQAFDTIVWDPAKECYFKPADYVWTRVALIREHDGYRRLVTAHDVAIVDGAVTSDESWEQIAELAQTSVETLRDPRKRLLDAIVDFRSDQLHDNLYRSALDATTRFAAPYINVEFAYERSVDPLDHHPFPEPPFHYLDWREVTRRHWQVALGGGQTNYYYQDTAWNLFIPFPEPPGYAAIRIFADFWDRTRFWQHVARPDLLRSGATDVYVRALAGEEYVVYSESGAAFELDLAGVTAPLHATWLDPYTGATRSEPTVDADAGSFQPPFGGEAAVLLLTT
jgi:hypothetical protein